MIVETQRGAFTDTTCLSDMADYFKSACEIFMEELGETLKTGVDTPRPPDIDQATLVKLIETPGVHGASAPSFLMKLLYGARVCAPCIVLPTQRLACFVHCWNTECDRRLKRLYD